MIIISYRRFDEKLRIFWLFRNNIWYFSVCTQRQIKWVNKQNTLKKRKKRCKVDSGLLGSKLWYKSREIDWVNFLWTSLKKRAVKTIDSFLQLLYKEKKMSDEVSVLEIKRRGKFWAAKWKCQQWKKNLEMHLLKVSKFQNQFMMSSFLPKNEQIFLRISALAFKKCSNQKTLLYNYVK